VGIGASTSKFHPERAAGHGWVPDTANIADHVVSSNNLREARLQSGESHVGQDQLAASTEAAVEGWRGGRGVYPASSAQLWDVECINQEATAKRPAGRDRRDASGAERTRARSQPGQTRKAQAILGAGLGHPSRRRRLPQVGAW